MEQRILGRTGIRVSAVGMGCEGFEGKSEAASRELLDFAIKKGIHFFDLYTSNPSVRRNVGSALSQYLRSHFVIQGHLGSAWKDGQYFRTRKINEVKEAFENLLSDMKLDYVDIGMIHYCDSPTDFEIILNGPVMEYAKDLKQKGVIGCVGISTHNPDVGFLAVESRLIDVIMLSVNPAYDMLPSNEDVNTLFEEGTFDRVYEGIDPKRDRLYQTCQNQGVALTVMKPFAGGLLLDDKQSPFGRAMTPVQCISYCLDRPAVASVMGGMASEAEILAAVSYCSAGSQEKDYSGILAGAPKSSFSGHCMYCGHCAPCAVKIDIASVNKYLDLALAQGFVPETVQNHYDLLEHHAGECIACGSCMKNCPFGTDVIHKMEQAADIFGK